MTSAGRWVFAVLVLATFGAFFVAQRLKHAPTVIQRFRAATVFSPNGDGRKDRERISFLIKRTDTVTVDIVDHSGSEVRHLLKATRLRKYTKLPTLVWDGRDDDGVLVPDGTYRARVTLRGEGRTIVVPHAFRKDTVAPRPRVTAIGPDKTPGPELLPRPGGGVATVHFLAPGSRPTILLFKTSPGRVRPVMAPVRLPANAKSWDWNGTVGGRPVSPGTYLVAVQSRDDAGNIGTSVPIVRKTQLPVLAFGRKLPGHGGITVRYLGAEPPSTTTQGGNVATIGVDARREKYSWSIRRVAGRPAPLKRGFGTRPLLHLHAPSGHSGVYLLSVRVKSHEQRVPLVVQSDLISGGTPQAPHGVLVVMPWLTWQGRNPLDDDGDGRANLLDDGLAASIDRVFTGDGLPAGFATNEAPLLSWLDRTHRTFDITTDEQLATQPRPRIESFHGVLIAGDARWLPAPLQVRLRRFVQQGGVVAELGTQSLERTIRISAHGRMSNVVIAPDDLFGEHLGSLVSPAPTLTTSKDALGLFKGTAGQLSGFPAYEPTLSAGAKGTIVASAVTPSGRTVVAALRYGRGLYLRPGVTGFADTLSKNRDAAQLMSRIWTLLSH